MKAWRKVRVLESWTGVEEEEEDEEEELDEDPGVDEETGVESDEGEEDDELPKMLSMKSHEASGATQARARVAIRVLLFKVKTSVTSLGM